MLDKLIMLISLGSTFHPCFTVSPHWTERLQVTKECFAPKYRLSQQYDLVMSFSPQRFWFWNSDPYLYPYACSISYHCNMFTSIGYTKCFILALTLNRIIECLVGTLTQLDFKKIGSFPGCLRGASSTWCARAYAPRVVRWRIWNWRG